MKLHYLSLFRKLKRGKIDVTFILRANRTAALARLTDKRHMAWLRFGWDLGGALAFSTILPTSNKSLEVIFVIHVSDFISFS